MTNEKISEQVKTIFKQIFKGEPELTLNENTSSNDIVSWNSLSHVILIDTIEKHFGIKFDLDAMLSMETFGEICCEAEKRINAK